MKTRIISGGIIVLISAAILGISLKFPIILPFTFAVLGTIAVYEVLYSTKLVNDKLTVFVSMLPAVIMPFSFIGIIGVRPAGIYTVFALLQFTLYLKNHSKFGLDGMFASILLPIFISYGFSAFSVLARFPKLYYVVLLLCFSAVSDTGAYFVGVLTGKHKMAPVISPKKSYEGLFGGMFFAVIFVLIVSFVYKNYLGINANVWVNVAITPVFVLIGVLGDLTASIIKRQCGIKDFGNIIPGHGGIMDRFDSNLMIAPALYWLVTYFPLVK